MIDPDLFEDFVKRDKIKRKINDNKINTNYNNNLINLDSNIRSKDSALGKLTKKMEGFSFKDDKPKKSNLIKFKNMRKINPLFLYLYNRETI